MTKERAIDKLTDKEREEFMKTIRRLHEEVEESREREREKHKAEEVWAKIYVMMIED